MNLKPLLTPPIIVRPIYMCPVCQTYYASEEEAQYCADSFPIAKQFPTLKPGDVIVLATGYTWFERKEWIAGVIPANPKSKSHFDHMDVHKFYYVVTALGVDEYHRYNFRFEDKRSRHSAHVSVATGAICKKGEPLMHNWISQSHKGHFTRVENQESVAHLRAAAKDLIGKTSDRLL